MQTRTGPMATRRSPQIAGEKMWKRRRRCTKSTTHGGRANRGSTGRWWWENRRRGAGLRRESMSAAQCPTSLTRSPASHRQCRQRWPACRRAQPRSPPRRHPRRRLQTCRRPRLRRARRRSGGKGLGRQGGRGGKEPWWGREREGTREDRRRRGGTEQRGWWQGLRGKGRGSGKGRRKGPRADPFNVADVGAGMDMRRREWRSQRESVVADILEVSEDEGDGAGRMAVEGGPRQPSAPNVPAAAMKCILLEVRRQEEGKGGRGQLEAGAAGSRDSSVSAGGRGRTSKGGKGQAGTSGAVHAKGHLAGKGGQRRWTGATVAAAPTLVQAVAAEVAPTGQCGSMG